MSIESQWHLRVAFTKGTSGSLEGLITSSTTAVNTLIMGHHNTESRSSSQPSVPMMASLPVTRTARVRLE